MVIAAANADLGSLGDSYDNAIPFIDDSDSGLYYSAYSAGVEILLVAPGGEVVATGEYASDIPAEEVEALLD